MQGGLTASPQKIFEMPRYRNELQTDNERSHRGIVIEFGIRAHSEWIGAAVCAAAILVPIARGFAAGELHPFYSRLTRFAYANGSINRVNIQSKVDRNGAYGLVQIRT
jgi:hypothetical protein